MQNKATLRSRILLIGLGIILMAAAVLIVGTGVHQEQHSADLSTGGGVMISSTAVDPAAYYLTNEQLAYYETVSEAFPARDMDTYHSRRAFHYAPPMIPHEILDEQSYGGDSCLRCHADGDFSPIFGGYAPTVPHPEMINCRQCHLPAATPDLYVPSDWQTAAAPALNRNALISSPHPIPHDLQMRENCLACHGGPAVPDEIRVPHPERVNCQQCHVLIESSQEWTR